MELSAYFQVLRRRMWVIMITLVVTLMVAVVGSTQLPLTYTATVTMQILTATSGSTDYLQYDVRYADRLMNTYANIATSQPILDELEKRFEFDAPPTVKTTMITNSELLKITVESYDAGLARDAANELGVILIEDAQIRYGEANAETIETLREQLAQSKAELDESREEYETKLSEDFPNAEQIQVLRDTVTVLEERYTALLAQYERIRALEELQAPSISIVESASTPQSPTQPQKLLIIGLAALVGAAGGLGLAFVIERFDTRLFTRKQIARLSKLPILGEIPALPKNQKTKIFTAYSVQEDAVRRIGIQLFSPPLEEQLPQAKTLLVSSAIPGEGKSTITANLGLALARTGHNTLLVDADPLRPQLHQIFDIPNGTGLVNVLQGEIDINQSIHCTAFEQLSMLTSGPWTPKLSSLLRPEAMAELLEQLKPRFDVILVDSPAFLAVADAAILASIVDEVLLVCLPKQIRRTALKAVIDQLSSLNVTPVGIVLNRSQTEGTHRNYYRWYGEDAIRAAQQTPVKPEPTHEKKSEAEATVDEAL